MEYKEIFKNSIQALKNNKLRTSLTMIGIVIGITAVILIYSIGQGAVAFITNEFSQFGTDYFQINPGTSEVAAIAGSKSLTFKDYDAIKNDISLTNIKSVAPQEMTSVKISANGEEDELLLYGTTHESFDILKPTLLYGDFMTAEQEAASEKIAVLGNDASEKFFGKDSNPVGQTIRINNKIFRITGVITSSSVLAGNFINNAVFMPVNVVTNDILGEERLQEIDISVKDQNSINQTMQDVEELLRDRHNLKEGDQNDFTMSSAKDILSTVQTVTGLLTTLVVAISGISLVVGGVGVMNIMLVSVTERTKEIGLLKAIGAKRRDILAQFLMEAVVMSLIGGVIGITLGIGGAFVVSLVAHIPFIVSLPAIFIAVGVSTLVGIAFGIYPARRAANLSPIDALRYE